MPINPDELLRVAANAGRVEMLDLIEARGEMTVTSMSAELSVTRTAISKHFRILREARMVKTRSEGLYVYYRIADDKALLELIGWRRRHRQ